MNEKKFATDFTHSLSVYGKNNPALYLSYANRIYKEPLIQAIPKPLGRVFRGFGLPSDDLITGSIKKAGFFLMNENESRCELKDKARQTAQSIEINGAVKPFKIMKNLHRQLDLIRDRYKKLVYCKDQISHAYEWLFDNYYILEREGRIVIKELSRLDRLPCNKSEGMPAVSIHAKCLCRTAAGELSAPVIEQYIEAVQTVRDFESCELSSFGLMLRAALIEGASRACTEKMDDAQRELLLSDAVKTLNFLTTFDFSEIIERQSKIEQILSKDPSGFYSKMDERSRALYRKKLAQIADKRKIGEADAAKRAVELAQNGKTEREKHVGYYIIENELDHKTKHGKGRLYLSLLVLIPAVFAALFGLLFKIIWLPLVLYLPLWEITRPVIDYFILKGVPATFMPRMNLESVIPDEAPTLVVVSTLLSSSAKIDEFVKKLEQFYYANGRGNIMFGILADLKQSRLPEQPEDKSVSSAAMKAINKLNKNYGRNFYLFIRSRRLSETQGTFSGWERKRGALIELIRCIKGQQTSISSIEGDINRLQSVKYLIALDADTRLLMDSAAEMVSVAMHPLNRPVIDAEKGIVTKGYGILTPRMGIDLNSAGLTPFSRVMAGCGGVTAYDNASGDVYQDLFCEGIFAGKGLIDVDAFYKILDHALPKNRILSHDILEGCFMRAGYVSDIELTDGFPARPGPWFDRLHRWIRGDWQNIGFIFGRIRNHDGFRKTPFNALSRFKLFDNLRRSATPVFAMLCMILAAFSSLRLSILLIAAAFLSLAGSGLFSALLAVIQGGPSMLSRKYHCKILPQALNSIAQGLMLYLFLPYNAYISLDGIIRALYRLTTGKKMLEWTTAAESEAKSGAFFEILKKFWITLFAGILFLLFSLTVLCRVFGALWIVTPFIAWLSGKAMQIGRDELSDEDAEKLRSYTAAMWRYYEDYAGNVDNYLPPDNVQEAPVHVVAHRTSPTNIGLMLLSTVAARDIRLIDSDTMFDRISKTLETLERMDKWNGHLYNWYDTKTLVPLRPRYISTVDSGNMLCCLVALREGLRDYKNESETAQNLIDRVQALLDSCDLSILFNKRRKLFHIGYDVEEGKLSEIYYDLLMSEARMTSYYAIAKRFAPKRHWGALGRTLAKQNGYTGPVSWTGTMFEYMMPHLLLPVYEDSMSAEALRFVIYCQKQRVKDRNVPWGISESGFYAFDAALNYQYKAHGVQKLALKRGMDKELVVSPYSTFIALPFDPAAGMKNLERFEEMGLFGRCGFFEAVDFTLKRTEGHFAAIKSYMAHHVGMSIVACANALLGGIMQERFMRDNEMRSAEELLQEKIPSQTVVFHDVLMRDIPDKPGRNQLVREEFEEISPVTPRVQTISNGEYTMVVTDTGASFSMFRGIDITRRSADLLRNPIGVYAVADFDGNVFSLTTAPEYSGERLVRRRVEFNSNGAVFKARFKGFEASMRACVHGQIPCELRMVELENMTQKKETATLLFYLEPTLAKTSDEAAHPAFSRIFLNASYRPDTKMLIFARRPRGNELPAFLAIGLCEHDVNFEFETARSDLLTRPDGISSLINAVSADFSNRAGAVPDAAAALRIKLDIPARSKREITLILAAANTAEEAVTRLIEIRRQGFHNVLHNAAGKDSNVMESRLAALILPQILFQAKETRDREKVKNRLGQQGLWSLGISGDYPILLFEYASQSDLERLEPYIKTHKALRLKGILTDLVITYKEGGDYARSQLNTLKESIRSAGCEYLIDSRAGIYLVNLNLHTPDICSLLVESACHIAAGSIIKRPPHESYSAVRFLPAPPKISDSPDGEHSLKVYAGTVTETGFITTHDSGSPYAPWCHILANRAFGTLLSDRALGYTWAVNARENKITPWSNDPVADNRGEMLILKSGSRYFDLCANARTSFEDGRAVYESEIGELSCRVTVTVPSKLMIKQISLEVLNKGESNMDFDASYYVEPVLGVETGVKRHVSFERKENAVFMRNSWAPVSGVGFLSALGCPCDILQSRAAFFSGRWNRTSESPLPAPGAAAIVRKKLPPRRSEKVTFVLGWAAKEEAAEKILNDLAPADQQKSSNIIFENSIQIKTPDKQLNLLFNTWLKYQFISSRINARTGFYQCGGAYGFRDQLQDCCAALLLNPDLAKTHIFRSAAHQFREGDVMHWWHQLPPRDGGSRGVRTRCSDDLLWLPYTVSEYIEKTGDLSLFEKDVHYLEAPELEKTEEDRYFIPQRSEKKENIYLHCVRAIERAMQYGQHGLPLFGSGDWNDGMNLVGIEGKGESVWLALFLAHVLEKFEPVCRIMKDDERAEKYLAEAQKLKKAVDETSWNGGWYLRGFFDDGFPLGGKENAECVIDSIPQSFSVISGMPVGERRKSALNSAFNILVDERLKIVKLFDPPFDSVGRNPGYIRSYPPGIRENGGQYTHAAVWLALALIMEGRCSDGYKILSLLNPIGKNLSKKDASVYRIEPYVLPADIYSNKSCEGRGGWSFYTGAAGWYYRTVLEYLLGIQIRADRILLRPSIPKDWNEFSAALELHGTRVKICVKRGEDKGLTVDSEKAEFIPVNSKEHTALLII